MLITEAWGQLAQEYGILADASGDRTVDMVVRVPGWPPVPCDVKVFAAPLTPTLLGRVANRHRRAGHHAQLLVVVPSATTSTLNFLAQVMVYGPPKPTDIPEIAAWKRARLDLPGVIEGSSVHLASRFTPRQGSLTQRLRRRCRRGQPSAERSRLKSPA